MSFPTRLVLRRASLPPLSPEESVWLGRREQQEQQQPWSRGAHLVPLLTLMTGVSLSRELGALRRGTSLLPEQPRGRPSALGSVLWLVPQPSRTPPSPASILRTT